MRSQTPSPRREAAARENPSVSESVPTELPKLPISPRAPLAKVLVLAVVHFVFVFALLMVPIHFRMLRPDTDQLVSRTIRLLLCASCTYVFFVRMCGLRARDIGLATPKNGATRFVLGVLVGAMCLTACFCIAWGKGGLVVSPAGPDEGPTSRDWMLRGGAMLVAALFEELAFRVAMVGVLARVLPVSLAVGLPAALFGLLHAMNPGATTLSVMNTALAGLLLGLLFFDRGATGRATGPSLPLATGFHFSWNVTMGYVYGIPISGHPTNARLLKTEPVDILWSGGSYGLEAGVAATIVLVVATVLAFLYAAPRLREQPAS